MKYFVAKAYAGGMIEEGKTFAEAAGYSVDLEGDGNQIVIDTEDKNVYVGSDGEDRLWSLDAVKTVIDENPVAVDEPVPEYVEPIDPVEDMPEPASFMEDEVEGDTVIVDGTLHVATNVEPLLITKSDYMLSITIG